MEFKNLESNILYCIGDEWIQSKKLKAFKKKLLFEEFSDIPGKNIEDAIESLKNNKFLEMTPENDRVILTQKGLSQIEAMQHYRRVRDQIKIFVEQLPDTLINKKPDIEFDPRQLLNGISADLNPISED